MKQTNVIASDAIRQSIRWQRLLVDPNPNSGERSQVFSSDITILPNYMIRVSEVGGPWPGVLARVHVSRAAINIFPRFDATVTIRNMFGAALSSENARLKAVMEAIEITCTERPSQRTYAGSYLEVRRFAIYPPDLLLFSEDEVSHSDFPFLPYSDELKIDWVWGYDITANLPVVVPVDCVFTSALATRPLVHVDATGGSAHTNMTLAILHGLYEVVERDALMIAWLNTSAGTRVDFAGVAYEPAALLSKLQEEMNGEIVVLDITSDVSIPTFMVVLCSSRLPRGLAVGAGAHIDRVRALENATLEVFMSVKYQLTEELDFTHMSAHRESWLRWFELISEQEYSTAPPSFAAHDSGPSELRRCVDLLQRRGLRMIAVDCTSPELSDLGLCCTKVLVPFMQPRFLNESEPRRLGSRRLQELRRVQAKGRTDLGLNTSLHPFL